MEFWLFLPEHFKRSVIKKLDYKSRCRFQKCSKLDRELVDSCPVSLEQVNFEPRLGNQVYMSIEEANAPEKLLCDQCKTIQEVLQDFLLIFKNPKSKVVKLSIAHFNFQRQPDAVNDFVMALFSEMESVYSRNFKLRIEKLSFHWGEMRDRNLLELVKKCDAKVFRTIFLRKFSIRTAEMIKELVETEQWKNLEEIRLQEKITIPLEKFFPINILNVSFHSLSAEDIWNYIQKYRSTPLTQHSFFQIYVSEEFQLPEILKLIDVPVKNEPLDVQNVNQYFKHTQRFPLPWSKEFVLVVKIAMRQIKGTICRIGSEKDDFDVLEMNFIQDVV